MSIFLFRPFRVKVRRRVEFRVPATLDEMEDQILYDTNLTDGPQQ